MGAAPPSKWRSPGDDPEPPRYVQRKLTPIDKARRIRLLEERLRADAISPEMLAELKYLRGSSPPVKALAVPPRPRTGDPDPEPPKRAVHLRLAAERADQIRKLERMLREGVRHPGLLEELNRLKSGR